MRPCIYSLSWVGGSHALKVFLGCLAPGVSWFYQNDTTAFQASIEIDDGFLASFLAKLHAYNVLYHFLSLGLRSSSVLDTAPKEQLVARQACTIARVHALAMRTAKSIKNTAFPIYRRIGQDCGSRRG